MGLNHAPTLTTPALIYSTHWVLNVCIIVAHFHLCSLLGMLSIIIPCPCPTSFTNLSHHRLPSCLRTDSMDHHWTVSSEHLRFWLLVSSLFFCLFPPAFRWTLIYCIVLYRIVLEVWTVRWPMLANARLLSNITPESLMKYWLHRCRHWGVNRLCP